MAFGGGVILVYNKFLDYAIPQVRPSVKDGTLSFATAVKYSIKLIDEHYEDVSCAFIFGSITQNRFKAYSDIDLVIVTKSQSSWRKVRDVIYGIPFEIQCFGLNSFDELECFCKKTGFLFGLYGIAHGEIICDYSGDALCLKERAKKTRDEGPLQMVLQTKNLLRTTISDYIIELITNKDKYENISIGMSLYESLAILVLSENRCWLARGKWIERQLKKLDKEISREIHKAYNELQAGNPEVLIELSCEILEKSGGPLWKGTNITSIPKVN